MNEAVGKIGTTYVPSWQAESWQQKRTQERNKYGKMMQIKQKSQVLRYREKHRNESPASVACDTYQRFLSVFLTLVDADEDKNVHVSISSRRLWHFYVLGCRSKFAWGESGEAKKHKGRPTSELCQ